MPVYRRLSWIYTEYFKSSELNPKPVLLIRPYIKDTSSEMNELRKRQNSSIIFKDMLWDMAWETPLAKDLNLYTNLLRYCEFGINAASTVSL